MNHLKRIFSYLIVAVVFLSCTEKKDSQTVSLYVDKTSPQVLYALNNSPKLYGISKFKVSTTLSEADIILTTDSTTQAPEGYSIKHVDNQLKIEAADSIGAMYAILDIAEQLSFGLNTKQIEEKKIVPSLRNRFIKFNLPWSSYRRGRALELHTETCRDTAFWRAFFRPDGNEPF